MKLENAVLHDTQSGPQESWPPGHFQQPQPVQQPVDLVPDYPYTEVEWFEDQEKFCTSKKLDQLDERKFSITMKALDFFSI